MGEEHNSFDRVQCLGGGRKGRSLKMIRSSKKVHACTLATLVPVCRSPKQTLSTQAIR